MRVAAAAMLGLAATHAASRAGQPVAGTSANRWFPASYQQSRARFRSACHHLEMTAHAACARYPVTYPDLPDHDLTIDTAYFSRGNVRLLIVQSGLHGVEAFAGAAVQQMLIARHLRTLLHRGFDVLLIHAVNPYGFRYLRRVDGNNVDLNRNFAPPGRDLYDQRNPAYVALRDIAEPHRPVLGVGTESTNLAVRTVLAYVAHGFDFSFISNGTHAGQYRFPEGLEFGGTEPAQQTRFFRDRIAPIMAGHPGDILFLDLHTGLGAANTLTVYSGLDWPQSHTAAMRRFVRALSRPHIRMETPSQSAYQTMGDVIDFVPTLVPGNRVTAVTLEWGTIGESTVDELATNARMILENQAHFHGCASEAICDAVRRNFLALFNPADAQFQTSVIEQADAFLTGLETLQPGQLAGVSAP